VTYIILINDIIRSRRLLRSSKLQLLSDLYTQSLNAARLHVRKLIWALIDIGVEPAMQALK